MNPVRNKSPQAAAAVPNAGRISNGMKILAIETSCDETALALVEARGGLRKPTFKILKNLVSSQIAVHRPFGGVVPNLAKREHLKNLPILFDQLLKTDNKLKTDLLAVTVGPGLEPALWTGINFAKEIKKKYFPKIPLIGVNHLEGHLYSFLLAKKTINPKSEIRNPKRENLEFRNSKFEFPAVALLVSGGHTILLRVESLIKWKKIGETRDDAAGEAFDKVAKMLNLPYPGGPEIEKLSKLGNPKAINFPRPMIHDNSPAGEYDFSFSGLKTSVLYYLRDNPKADRADVAASFQKAAVDVLVAKTIRAAKKYGVKSIILSGGVAANAFLRETLGNEAKKIGRNFLVPPMNFNTDNAAMIAVAAYIQHLRKKSPSYQASQPAIHAQANLSL